MHLTSVLISDPASSENLPVSIFCYNDERRFLRVCESYEETLKRVANSFHIPQDQLPLLRTSCFTACRNEYVIIDRSAYPLLWSNLEEILVTTEPIQKQIVNDVQNSGNSNIPSQPPDKDPPSFYAAGSSKDGLTETLQKDHPILSAANESEDNAQKEDDMPNLTPQDAQKPDPLFDWDENISQSHVKRKQREKTPTTARPEKKFKAAPRSLVKSESSSAVLSKQKDPEVSMTQESVVSDSPSKKAIRPTADDDTRFDVIIIGPDEDPTQFKLRGKNSIRKVLVAACKNFDVDPNRASLVHRMKLEVDGEEQTHNFVCPLDDTIAMCGIKTGSELFVDVGRGGVEDSSDSD